MDTIVSIIIAILILLLAITFLKHPKQILIAIFGGIFRGVFKIDVLENLKETNKDELEEIDYEIQKKIQFDFGKSKKTIITESDNINIVKEIEEALETQNEVYHTEKFEILNQGNQKIIKIKNGISFYSFHFLIEWLKMKSNECYGIVEFEKLKYFIYKDPNSLNNLIGMTNNGDKIFVDLFTDYNKEEFLSVNSEIKIDKKIEIPTDVG